MRLLLSVWAEDLPNASAFGSPDPFAVVTVLSAEPGVKPTLLGQTEVISDTHSPDWTKSFYIEDFELGKQMNMAISIYDSNQRQSHPMGSTLFEVGTVLGKPGSIMAKELKGGGIIVVHVEEASESGSLDFQIRGVKFKSTEGVGMFNRSDPFFEFQRLRTSARDGARVWDCVFRSDHIKNNLSPVWNQGSIELDVLCNGKTAQPFRLVAYDYETNGKHVFMGDVKLSVDQMIHAATEGAVGPPERVNMDKAFALKNSADQDVGRIVVALARITGASPKMQYQEAVEAELDVAVEGADIAVASPGEELEVEAYEISVGEPTFVNYVSGGCQLRTVVAIDSTASNGDPRQATSLHHFRTDGRNEYEDAIFSLCSVLSKFDSDHRYPVYGFGAKRSGALSHCFPIGPTKEVDGADGILKVYREAFRSGIIMSSPKDFSEVIKAAAEDAKTELVSRTHGARL